LLCACADRRIADESAPAHGRRREEVHRIANLLAQHDAAAQHALRYYLRGSTEWALVLPVVRRCIRDLLNDCGRSLETDVHIELLEFAAEYGLSIRLTASGAEPSNERIACRVTATQKDAIEMAAKLAKQG
jgi:hypothetical protein